MRRLNFNSESGSALIEFVGLSVALMLPVMWFSIDLIGKQNDQFAATAIAEHGLRAWVQSDAVGSSNFLHALEQITSDFHEAKSETSWQFDCGAVQPCRPEGQVVRLVVHVKSATASAVMRWAKY